MSKRPRTILRQTPLGVSRKVTRTRRSHGTRRLPFTVASFRIWRGSQVCAAWDPTLYTTHSRYRPNGLAWGGIQPRYSGLRVQGTASSPSSTTVVIIVAALIYCQRSVLCRMPSCPLHQPSVLSSYPPQGWGRGSCRLPRPCPRSLSLPMIGPLFTTPCARPWLPA